MNRRLSRTVPVAMGSITAALLLATAGASEPAQPQGRMESPSGSPASGVTVVDPRDMVLEPGGRLGESSPRQPERRVGPAYRWSRGTATTAQVNVDSMGNNVLGDAANEPSMAIDPTDPDVIIVGWRQFDTIASNFRTSGNAYSHDGGTTWTFPGVLEPGEFSSDPVLDFDLEGNIYYNGLQPNRGPGEWACYVYKTSDGGLTWPQEIYAYGGDKQWMAIDRTSGTGTGNIYAAWSPWASCCGLGLFTRSTDSGLTFSEPVPVPGSPFWGTMTVDVDGAVYVTGISGFPSGIGPTLLVVKSTNAQNPQVTPSLAQVAEVDIGGQPTYQQAPNPAGLLGQMWIISDHSSGATRGNLYLIASVVPFSGNDPSDVMFSRSTDGGITWSTAIRINDDPIGNGAWQWFGTPSVAPNGRIDVVWNDTRNSGLANVSELYHSSSFDGGLTWTPSIAISPPFDSHLGWPQQNKLGDYYEMISDDTGASLAWAATFNGEQDVYFTRITAVPDCNGNGISDAIDIANETSDDCNDNGVPDECESDVDCNLNGVQDICDIALGTSDDLNGNGVPDECECTLELVWQPVESGVVKNRYLSFVPDNPGRLTAIRITPRSMPAGFISLEHAHYWVQEPEEFCEISGQVRPGDSEWDQCGPNPAPPGPTFLVAGLQCTPLYRDWGAVGQLYVIGEEIVPEATYDVQAILDGCAQTYEPNYSSPLVVATATRYGDLIGDWNGEQWTAPNGIADFQDISAIVDKFRNLPDAPNKAWADLVPELPNGLIDFLDISSGVDGFRGMTYSFPAPAACPSP